MRFLAISMSMYACPSQLLLQHACLSLSCIVAGCHSVSGFSKNCFATRMWLAEKKLQVLGTDADALLNKCLRHELNKHSFDTRGCRVEHADCRPVPISNLSPKYFKPLCCSFATEHVPRTMQKAGYLAGFDIGSLILGPTRHMTKSL